MPKKKILMIDFDQEFLKFLSGAMADEGFEVVTATDGLSGFEKFSEIHPDLVIMEAMLPKFHGFELCSRITSHPTKKAPVIIVTGIYRDSVYKTEALRSLGASAFFEKPLNLEELLNKVYELIGKPEVKKVSVSSDEELDKLLKEALSFDIRARKPAGQARAVEKPVHKPEPVRSKDDEVDLILKSKLKDLISENSVSELKPVSPPAAKPEKQRPAARPAEPKKTATPAGPGSLVSEQVKKPEAPAAVSRPIRPEIKKSEPSSVAGPEAKSETKIERQPRTASVPVASPFKGFIEEETEKKKVKKGSTKYIGLVAAILVVAGAVAFLTMKKKETPAFTGQTSNQVAALQTRGSEPPETRLSEEEISQEIEKQMEAYRAEKIQSSGTSQTGSNSQSQSRQAARRAVSNPLAAPIIPEQTPSLATIISNQAPEPENLAVQTAETVPARTEAQDEKPETVTEQTQATEEPPITIPVEEVKAGDLVPLTMVDVEPRPVKTVDPIYPEADRRLGIKGQILVNVLVSEDGEVLEAAVIRGIKGSVALEKEAVNAIKKWKFLPAEKNGVKVKVWKPIAIGFGLNK